jgi:hypothetical protein
MGIESSVLVLARERSHRAGLVTSSGASLNTDCSESNRRYVGQIAFRIAIRAASRLGLLRSDTDGAGLGSYNKLMS